MLTSEELFWAKVLKGPGCWEWQGKRTPLGYGRVIRRSGGRIREIYAHRMAYELTHGPIPAGMNVLHGCDNPPCARPDHLRLGTQRENVRDAVDRGRWIQAGSGGRRS